jgi:starch synthase
MPAGASSTNQSAASPDSPLIGTTPTISKPEASDTKHELIFDAQNVIAKPPQHAIPTATITDKPPQASEVAATKPVLETNSPTQIGLRFEPKPAEPEKSAPEPADELSKASSPVPSTPATETKTISAKTPISAPVPAAVPLVSLASALDAIKLEVPVVKTEPTPVRPPVAPPPNATKGAAVPAPFSKVKVSEITQSTAPAAPSVSKPVPPGGSELKKSDKPIPSPARPPVEKIYEEQIVNDLPTIKEPEAKEEDDAAAPTPQPPASPQRTIKPMFVVMITPELAPVAKVGGLGDVTFGLARELELRGNAVEIILPKYDCMRYHHIFGLTKAYEHLQVPWFNGVIDTTVWFGFVHGRKCYFIDPHSQDRFFNRGVYYGQHDDLMRFAFFCRAAMEFMLKTGKHPEIIHCHDWQTALVPVLLWEMYQHLGMRHPRVCFTIHNFKHQGWASEHMLRATGLNRPEHFYSYDRMRDNHNPRELNLMKGGIVYSNFVTTVSPRHAWEAKDGGQAFGLEPTLHTHHQKYGGVLNGLDYDMFNPGKDPHIPSHYNAKKIQKKYDNKRALRQRLWLADNEKPIVAFIGRLDPQKGPELVRHAIFHALNNRAQFVLLGESPDKAINDHFWGLKRHLNDSPDCHLEIGYSDELAHLIYAGADMMVVPSRFEPCGLTQLISLRYGTVPIVRSVGGLADTVFDKDHSNLPLHARNGYVFHGADNAGIESALNRALSCYYQFPEHFRHLMVNGMKCDYSWNHPGQHYMNIYDHIRDK